MDSLNHNRGHESLDHNSTKLDFITKSLLAGFTFVLGEKWDCDVIAMVRNRNEIYTLGIEYERSPRNVLRNASRCRAVGCNDVLLVCKDQSVADAARRIIQKIINNDDKVHIHVINRSHLTVRMLRQFCVRKGDRT